MFFFILPGGKKAMVIIVLRKQQIRTGKMSVYDRISWRLEDNHSMEQLSRVTLYYTPNLVEVGVFFIIRLCTRHACLYFHTVFRKFEDFCKTFAFPNFL